ncbi:hypothetical protein EDB89DRAFT_434559 [Lactarius sanguifluus]|nr:hypothetical protein EDB89DRAFT_434559 [Lactarius sanguifluus]
MSLAAPDSLLVPPAVNARRRLHRRSSCSSIPRSVSAQSWAFDLSSEDLRVPADPGEVEVYMAPLFRGPEGLREAHDETAKPVFATHPDGFDSRAKSSHCDDSCSENLSNYHFDIAGQDHDYSEQLNPSEINPSLERSPAPSQQVPSVVPKPQSDRPVRRQPLPAQTPPVPAFPRPLVLVEAARQDPPITGTRPLRIDRSKKRQELGGSGGGSQRTPRADAPYVRPPARSIHRAATQVNLREAYRRASPHSADRVGQTRLIPVARPPPLGPLPEVPDSSVNKVPVATLFPTSLIPLQHAQDKFRHAHCLDRLPPPTLNQSDIANPPTPSSGNRSPRTLGWSFGRAFRKQKA